MPTTQGSIKLFTLFGIGVYLHWSWFILAAYCVQARGHVYSSMLWNVAEVLGLFLIILTHEFGHQLATRQVGGKTHDIILWPLGGVAYVTPPERPGAQLWSIAAGPLVNVLLVPVFSLFLLASSSLGWPAAHPDLANFIFNIWKINLVLLTFNLLPVYPLDGGQILRSLLWFIFGRGNSLFIASIIGLIGLVGVVGVAIFLRSLWLGVIAFFILMNCWDGLRLAMVLSRLDKLPKRDGFLCPACRSAPPIAELWQCSKCRRPFDIFLNQCTCPHCGSQFAGAPCVNCGTASPFTEWLVAPPSSN